MSEEHVPAATPEPVAAPPVAEPPAPVAETPAAPAVAAEVPAEPAVPAEETPAEPALKPHTDEPGLLSVAEAEGKPAEPEKPTEPAETETKPPEPTETIEYNLNFPDGREIIAESVENFVNFARESNIPPETAQKLTDMHMAALDAYDAATLQRQHDAFAQTRAEWKNQILSDPELGGSGFETNRKLAVRALDAIVPPERREAFNQALMLTGMSDHPEFFRAMVAAGKKWTEPGVAPPPAAPPPGNQRATSGGNSSRLPYAYPRGRRGGAA